MRSMPAITRLSYFDVALHALCSDQPPTVDAVRQAISRHVEELSLRGEARLTKDVNDPGSFRNTAVDVLREMMRWGWIEPTPLADAKAAFEMIRQSLVPLTKAGVDAAKTSDAERRDMIGVLALRTNQLLSEFLEWLQTYDLAIPEWSDGDVRAALSGSEKASPAEVHVLAVMACETYGVVERACASTYGRSLPPGPGPDFVAKHVTAYLEKRFGKRVPKTHKELVGAAGDGLAKAYLMHFGLRADSNGLERALAWSRDLFLAGSGRAVLGVPAWLSWSAADINRNSDEIIFVRRRVTEHRDAVVQAVHTAYAAAAAPSRARGMASPLVPIYVVRETAAYAARVCEPVVERVLAEMLQNAAGPEIVQMQLGDLRAFPPSAGPFRIGEARYYYMTIHNRSLE